MQRDDKWVVSIKGAAGQKHCEVSVVHESNQHGLISYGWPSRWKIIVWSTGCDAVLWPCVYAGVVQVANEVAEHLNAGGELCDSVLRKGEGK